MTEELDENWLDRLKAKATSKPNNKNSSIKSRIKQLRKKSTNMLDFLMDMEVMVGKESELWSGLKKIEETTQNLISDIDDFINGKDSVDKEINDQPGDKEKSKTQSWSPQDIEKTSGSSRKTRNYTDKRKTNNFQSDISKEKEDLSNFFSKRFQKDLDPETEKDFSKTTGKMPAVKSKPEPKKTVDEPGKNNVRSSVPRSPELNKIAQRLKKNKRK